MSKNISPLRFGTESKTDSLVSVAHYYSYHT